MKDRKKRVRGGLVGYPLQSELFNKSILKRLMRSLHAAFGLRAMGAQNVDIELVKRAAKLRHAVAYLAVALEYAKDCVLVRVQCNRLAVALEVASCRRHIVKRSLRVDKAQLFELACCVVHIHQIVA